MSTQSLHRTLSPKPQRNLRRSPSDPIHLSVPPGGQGGQTNNGKIYVLSADGSSLFLLDPTKPNNNEEPPPYAPFHITPRETSTLLPSPSSTARSLTSPRGRSSTLQDHTRPGIRQTASYTSLNADEHTPLLAEREGLDEEWTDITWYQRRPLFKAIFCGELEEGDLGTRWVDGWRRFWRPVGQAKYWKAMAHLCFINFPFALFVWPPLIAGTLAGTALLITLPIGAAVWWLTLFIARSSARLETVMQLNHHSPLRPLISQPKYRPIFYRIKERNSQPVSPVSEVPPDLTIVWEKRFIKCSYAMFCDHYSYSALSYFLLIKPLIVLFSTILLWALFPVCLVLVVTLPMYLRAARRWGQWQAGVAIENL